MRAATAELMHFQLELMEQHGIDRRFGVAYEVVNFQRSDLQQVGAWRSCLLMNYLVIN